MTMLNISRPYWSDGSYWVNFRYKSGTSMGQGRIEASTEKSVKDLATRMAEAYDYDYSA
jgi:hypothetical protein